MKNSHSDYNIDTDAVAYPRTDLACEAPAPSGDGEGSIYKEYTLSGFEISELIVLNEHGMEETGRPIGRYVTLYCPVIRNWEDEITDTAADALAHLLKEFTEKLTGKPVTPKTRVLVAGLGNRFITADAVGPRTADKVVVTSHMMGNGGIFDELGCCSVSAVHPGVMGQTGIEAAKVIRGATAAIHPDVVVAIDALAARATERLAATIQFSDSGIAPGSGIGNRRTSIDRETLDCPVIAIGVPTVVDSSTLVYDALEKAGMSADTPELKDVLTSGRDFFVSLKDSDVISDSVSSLLALSINRAFFTEGL